MAITTAQRNAGYRQLALLLAADYPEHLDKLYRIIVREVKGGNATQREIAKAVGRELYQAAYGVDPVGRHEFRHLLHNALQSPDESGDGLTLDDAFEADNVVVN